MGTDTQFVPGLYMRLASLTEHHPVMRPRPLTLRTADFASAASTPISSRIRREHTARSGVRLFRIGDGHACVLCPGNGLPLTAVMVCSRPPVCPQVYQEWSSMCAAACPTRVLAPVKRRIRAPGSDDQTG